MAWQTNPIVIGARNIGRKMGLNALFAKFMSDGSYEKRFEFSLLSQVHSGDIVWDVGANIGLYTKRFAALVGDGGRVIAFEPSPTNFVRLQRAVEDNEICTLQNIGLGDSDSVLAFVQGEDALGATSRFESKGAKNAIAVQVRRAEQVVSEGICPEPTVVKIDVEGFELEVLRGFGALLDSDSLRVVAIEIHFSLLHERGLGHTPKKIETMLGYAGFGVNWPDSSHIVAIRPT